MSFNSPYHPLPEEPVFHSVPQPWRTLRGLRPVIMQVIPRMGAGGAEAGTVDAARAIVQAGGKAIVVSNGGYREQDLKRAGALHIKLPVHSKNPFTIKRNTKRLLELIRLHNVDIIHARSRAPAWSCFWACEQSRAKLVTTFHAAYGLGGKWKNRYNSVMAKGERVIAISKFIADHILANYEISPDKIVIVYRGIPLRKFHPNAVTAQQMVELSKAWQLPEDKHIILMPARLTRIKGHDVLLESLAKLERDDYVCVMLGSEKSRMRYQQELERKAAKLGLGAKIKFVPPCTDMPAAMRLSAVVVYPSQVPEGFGRVPVEAQAMGRPVIASSIGATTETILDGETGYLVDPQDSTKFAKVLDHLLSLDSESQMKFATRAMHFAANNFSHRDMCAELLSIYHDLLSEG